MHRYNMVHDADPSCRTKMLVRPDGKYVRYDDAQAKIARLTAERDDWAYKFNESCNTYSEMHVSLEKAEDERDQALARAAAAAMEMRERAADAMEDYCSDAPDLSGHGHSTFMKDVIYDLPLSPDGQQALDKLLAKAREDAIREAAALCAPKKAKVTRGDRFTPSTKDPQSVAAQAARKQCQDAILALLNEGEQNE